MERRVVITGLGAVTPIGNNTKDFWEGIKEGKCGIDEITRGNYSAAYHMIIMFFVSLNNFVEWMVFGLLSLLMLFVNV